jgi:hypothetical protein
VDDPPHARRDQRRDPLLIAPWLARLYDEPALAGALRLFAPWFLIFGLESMSFPLRGAPAARALVNYTECSRRRSARRSSHRGVVLSGATTAAWSSACWSTVPHHRGSYLFYRSERPAAAVRPPHRRRSLGSSRYTVPSSLVTLLVSQFDKFVVPQAVQHPAPGPVRPGGQHRRAHRGAGQQITRSVLFPRCAAAFRRDPATVREAYYARTPS